MTIGRTLVIICDLDNCFFDSRALEKYVPKDKMSREGWDEFARHYDECIPNKRILDLVVPTEEIMPIYFLTAREDLSYIPVRETTIRTIYEASGGKIDLNDKNCHHKLIMRRQFDYRPSAEVKEDMLVSIVKEGFIPILAIDDDPANCEMFRKYEIPTKYYDELSREVATK